MRRSVVIAVAIVLGFVAAAASGCGGKAASSGGCEKADLPQPENRHVEAPTRRLIPGKAYALTFDTTCGTFVVALDPKLAPNTVASLVSLARVGYFHDTIFHRIVPGFVIQGGDPTQSGSGGPGYSTVDVPPSGARYTKGVVAMAKAQEEPPGTAGSQFFVVTEADAGLPPEYAIVGRVRSGMSVVERIAPLGDESGRPTRTVVVRKATVAVS